MKRVVLIDDDRDDAEVFQEALEEVGNHFVFQYFENGESALAEWSKEEKLLPDIIFLDLNLPQISGWEILQHVRQTHDLASIPVVMYTTSSLKSELEMSLDQGANFFITKPTNYNELKRLLAEVLGKVLM
ncbi:response regulator [Chitinophagaceae bacterium LB-8]|uniref:Response regulator n=1 Tax=Paraflavisolibacter caeni TaxID=2982496 RepID=A0A9X3B8A4_9BACT|nr:response regulator [Paraflavisolibacter caeni]MCU7549441.1 response regulator [Paraflavisolibacter caeni]